MAVRFSDLQLAFEFVSSGGTGENEAYLDRQSGKIYWHSEFGDNAEECPMINAAHIWRARAARRWPGAASSWGWITRLRDTRALAISAEGRAGLAKTFGIALPA